MAKGTKLSEFEKEEYTAVKRVVKSQREISNVLGRRKTVICNYLKVQINMEPKKRLTGHKIITTIHEVKKKTSPT